MQRGYAVLAREHRIVNLDDVRDAIVVANQSSDAVGDIRRLGTRSNRWVKVSTAARRDQLTEPGSMAKIPPKYNIVDDVMGYVVGTRPGRSIRLTATERLGHQSSTIQIILLRHGNRVNWVGQAPQVLVDVEDVLNFC
jgi:hypothetical protein